MGLYGALVVRRPRAGQAYAGDTDTAFDADSVLVLGEIDPALNNAADQAAFDMRKYSPGYFLVNGRAYPDTDRSPTPAAAPACCATSTPGTQYHSMGVLGARADVIALDGSPLRVRPPLRRGDLRPRPDRRRARRRSPRAAAGHSLTVYDASLLLHNSNTAGVGGMLTTVAGRRRLVGVRTRPARSVRGCHGPRTTS